MRSEEQLSLKMLQEKNEGLLNLKEASVWASWYLNRKVTISNISYLIQYGRITNHGNNGNPLIDKNELKNYYDSLNKKIQSQKVLNKDINWHLSFVEYKEAERVKSFFSCKSG